MTPKKCRSIVAETSSQCKKYAIRGTSYCWNHTPKKESIIILIIGALLSTVFTAGYNEIKLIQTQERLKTQILTSLKFEFQDNKSCWYENYEILTQDRGALQQEKTKNFLKENQIWITLRPLCNFSFKTWENAKRENSDLFDTTLGEDKLDLFEKFYGCLLKIQDYIGEREKHREIKERNKEGYQMFEMANQNVITLLERHESILKKMEDLFNSNNAPKGPEFHGHAGG